MVLQLAAVGSNLCYAFLFHVRVSQTSFFTARQTIQSKRVAFSPFSVVSRCGDVVLRRPAENNRG